MFFTSRQPPSSAIGMLRKRGWPVNWDANKTMAEKRQQINELFNSALEQSPGEREAFLRQACGNDQSLYAEVESLLLHYDDSFLEEPPASEIPSFPGHAMVGKQIGAYRIIRECGHGGMAGGLHRGA